MSNSEGSTFDSVDNLVPSGRVSSKLLTQFGYQSLFFCTMHKKIVDAKGLNKTNVCILLKKEHVKMTESTKTGEELSLNNLFNKATEK